MWYPIELIKMDENGMVARATTDSGSPWFSGHFPDDPILPGIAQLNMVAGLIAASREDALQMTGLSRVKFRKIVRPGETLDIHAVPGSVKDQYQFRLSRSNEEICSGMMYFAAKDKL